MFGLESYNNQTKKAIQIIEANKNLADIEFLEMQIEEFLASKYRHDMMTAHRYMNGRHDILKRKRGLYKNNNIFVETPRLPNNKIVDNQYAKAVEQKTNYLFARSLTVTSENKQLEEEIKHLFNKRFQKTFKKLGENAINYGIGYIFPYLQNDVIKFKNFAPYEVLPLWSDEEQTELDALIRVYQIEVYNRNKKDVVTKVEVYGKVAVSYYTYDNKLIFEKTEAYLQLENNTLSFDFVPVIPFKSADPKPLINKVKSLQDALNLIKSNFVNYMEEDPRTTWLILKDNGGTDLEEFKLNMTEYGIMKIDTYEGGGGVETLSIEVDSNNYTVIIDMLKKTIIENTKSFDVKDERMSNNPNQMNIRSMYSDIDLDSNGIEVEFQCSLEQMFDLIKIYLEILGKGSFSNEVIEVKFNKDQLLNTTDVVSNLEKSFGMLSRETILKNHPFVEDVEQELKKIKDEQTILVDDAYDME